MNWDQIEGNWKQFKGQVRQCWGKLTRAAGWLCAQSHDDCRLAGGVKNPARGVEKG